MITDRFGALLEELSQATGIRLSPDKNNSCRIRYPDGLEITFAPDSGQEIVHAVVEIGTPGEGKYRENILREALKANGLSSHIGIFCYGKTKDSLLLYDRFSMDGLRGERLLELTAKLLEKARIWKESIGRGEIPSYKSNEFAFGAGPKSGMFGLK